MANTQVADTSKRQTGKQKAAAAKAAGAKGKAAETEKTERNVVPVIKSGAMSADVGPFVVKNWSQTIADEQKGQELIASAQGKRYDLIGQLTLAIVKAAKADSSIDLTATTKQGPEGTRAMTKLNDQIYLALGLKVVTSVGKGDDKRDKLVWAPSVVSYFPQAGEDKNTDAARAKNTLRSNLSHTVKKCEMAALAVIEKNITAKMDKKAGTLLLSGPAIKKEFGQDSVHLDERQTIPGKKEGEEIKLKQKPSFTAVADMAAKAYGGELRRGSNTRGTGAVGGHASGSGTTLIDPVKALAQLSASVVKACEKIDVPNEAQIKALEAMQNAIDKVLDNRAGDSK